MRLRQYLVLKGNIPSGLYIGLGCLSFAVLMAVWCILTYGGVVPALFLPSPSEVAVQFYRMLTELNLVGDILASVYRVSAGFLLASLMGVPLGLLMGSFKLAEGLIEPLVGFVRYMPASAFIPLLILWIGIGDLEKNRSDFHRYLFPAGSDDPGCGQEYLPRVDRHFVYTRGLLKGLLFSRWFCPAALPGIVDTLRITLGWAWTYLVVAELVGASSGLGYMIMEAQRFLRTAGLLWASW